MFNGFKAEDIDAGGLRVHMVHAGSGPPLLLLHGYPQTHAMWHQVAPALSDRFHVICADLRGYGDSDKPTGNPDHGNYAKRTMAHDMIQVMLALGYEEFFVAGHDRGARVTHRMALDHPQRVIRACVMDIAPTYRMFASTDKVFATRYYHWFFLIQPDGLPERLIGNDPEYFLTEKLRRWAAPRARFDPAAVREYLRCFSDPAAIHGSCEDYRAAASIDLEHDKADMSRHIECPLLVLWGARGFIEQNYDVLATWRERAADVSGHALDCGHFLPEEQPEAVIAALEEFFG